MLTFVALTRVNSGRYDGTLLVNLDRVLTMQRIDNRYTALVFAALAGGDTDSVGGFDGFDVAEAPGEILAALHNAQKDAQRT